MIPLVELPKIVEHYAPHFRDVFSAEAFVQFQRYVSGLLVSENKSVESINRLCVYASRNQSSLNRLLTESPFSLSEVNKARFAMMNSVEAMRLKANGVLSIDDTLLTHHGKHFDEIAYLYDSSQGCYSWAHNLVTLHYSDELTDYPVEFELWRPAQLDKIEAGLIAAQVAVKASKQALKQSEPHKWRQYVLGLWSRHQEQPEIAALYDSKLRIAEGVTSGSRIPVEDHRPLPGKLPSCSTSIGRRVCHDCSVKAAGKRAGCLSIRDEEISDRAVQFAQAVVSGIVGEILSALPASRNEILQCGHPTGKLQAVRGKGQNRPLFLSIRSQTSRRRSQHTLGLGGD